MQKLGRLTAAAVLAAVLIAPALAQQGPRAGDVPEMAKPDRAGEPAESRKLKKAAGATGRKGAEAAEKEGEGEVRKLKKIPPPASPKAKSGDGAGFRASEKDSSPVEPPRKTP